MTDLLIPDVSEFQGSVNWAALGAACPAVILRAHNGYRADLTFRANLAGARAHTQWRGFYQYLPASVDPVAAARALQSTVGPLQPGEVVILDLEVGAGDQRARRQAWLNTLHDPIEWTYSGLAFARDHLPGVSLDWVAAYQGTEPTAAHRLWQFTDARRFPGIANPCDASVFHGSLADLIGAHPAASTDWFDMATQADLEAAVRSVLGVAPGRRVLNDADGNTLRSDIGYIRDQILGANNALKDQIAAVNDPAKIAAAIPDSLAQQVVDALAARLKTGA